MSIQKIMLDHGSTVHREAKGRTVKMLRGPRYVNARCELETGQAERFRLLLGESITFDSDIQSIELSHPATPYVGAVEPIELYIGSSRQGDTARPSQNQAHFSLGQGQAAWASNYSKIQLGNRGAQSTETMIYLRRVQARTSATGPVHIHLQRYNLPGGILLPATYSSLGGANARASDFYSTGSAKTSIGLLSSLLTTTNDAANTNDNLASGNMGILDFHPAEPVEVPPSTSVMVWHDTVNTEIAVSFEWSEYDLSESMQ